MIDGLTFEYAQARTGARLSQRPDDRLWMHLRSARSVAALLDAMRTTPAAPLVSGVALSGDADAMELAFRQQMRTRITEIAGWAPAPWRAAILYTRHLLDLPALVHLLSDEAPPRWIAADPELSAYALPSLSQRRAALLDGPLAPTASALEQEALPVESLGRMLRRLGSSYSIHRALVAWESEWRGRWPRVDDDERASLDELAATIRGHLARFAKLARDETAAAREALATRLATRVHRCAGQPAALFAYLAVFAIDLERLRGEFVLRARPLARKAVA